MKPRQLTDFRGGWQVQREIIHADGTRAAFRGVADWRPTPQGLDYVETGQLLIPGQTPFAASRSYLWRADLSVWFSDGRFFHRIPPLGGATSHWCDPDQYEGQYDFQPWPLFRVTWQVSGPRKSYRMISTYRRV